MPLPAGLTPVTTLDPIAEATLATIQKLLGQDAQATTATASTPGATSAAGAAASATATSWAELAADFGARIVATNGPTARVTGPAASPTGQPALAEELPSPTIGSTAQAAGAGASAGLHLPGQAVAAPGAPAQGTAASLGEALDAGPMADAETGAGQGATEAATDRQPFSIGVAPSRMVSEAPAAGPVQASAATPVVSQIADGALLAARNIGQSVEMILQPEGLGTVSLRVTVERAGLGVHIAVDNPQTRELVQASWPQLQQTLDQRGLSVQSMLLDLSQGRSGDAAFSQFQQFNDQQFTGQRPGEQRPGGGQTSDRHAGAGGSVADEGASTPSASARGASRVDYRI